MDQGSFFTSSEERWVWIDLEMTGLNEDECVIIQAAMVITDCHLNELSCCDMVIWQPERLLDAMPPFVREMHTKNGLLQQVQTSHGRPDPRKGQSEPEGQTVGARDELGEQVRARRDCLAGRGQERGPAYQAAQSGDGDNGAGHFGDRSLQFGAPLHDGRRTVWPCVMHP